MENFKYLPTQKRLQRVDNWNCFASKSCESLNNEVASTRCTTLADSDGKIRPLKHKLIGLPVAIQPVDVKPNVQFSLSPSRSWIFPRNNQTVNSVNEQELRSTKPSNLPRRSVSLHKLSLLKSEDKLKHNPEAFTEKNVILKNRFSNSKTTENLSSDNMTSSRLISFSSNQWNKKNQGTGQFIQSMKANRTEFRASELFKSQKKTKHLSFFDLHEITLRQSYEDLSKSLNNLSATLRIQETTNVLQSKQLRLSRVENVINADSFMDDLLYRRMQKDLLMMEKNYHETEKESFALKNNVPRRSRSTTDLINLRREKLKPQSEGQAPRCCTAQGTTSIKISTPLVTTRKEVVRYKELSQSNNHNRLAAGKPIHHSLRIN